MVDDDRDVLWALAHILLGAGCLVTTAARGEEALARLAREPYDLVFIDAKLPDLDGYELAKRIMRQSPRTARILMSGYYDAQDPDVVAALEHHLFLRFVAKPFSTSEIRQIAQHVARERRGGRDDGPDFGGG